MKILVVDDDPIALESLALTLADLNLEFVSCSSSVEALEQAATGSFQFVMSAWNTQELCGADLCRTIRRIGLPGYVYFVLMNEVDRSKRMVDALEAGADDMMNKPLDPRELVGRLRAAERVLSLQTRDLTIFALAKLAESRDPETGAHLDRVRNYAKCIAEQMRNLPSFRNQIDSAFIRLIYETAPLHDIGKVAIPDHVLLKPGKLTPEEMEIMKRHTLVGAQTLSAALEHSPLTPYLRTAREIARSHHERWDGKGYPDGLRGESIPLSARIVSVADVYDALTSSRVYKASYEHARAMQIILEGRGTQFDARVVDAFFAIESQVLKIRAKHAEAKSAAMAA